MHFEHGLTDRNAERYMLPHRIRELCRCLLDEVARYDRVVLESIELREGDGPWRAFDTQRECWGGRDQHFFFRQRVVIPEDMAGRQVRYAVTPGPNGGWYWGAPQVLAYVDGEARQGLDSNHRELILTHKAEAGRAYDVLLDAYCDMYHYQDPLQMRTSLVCVDPEAEALYYDLMTPLLAAEQLPVDDTGRIDLLDRLNEACSLLDLRTGRCEAALASVREAKRFVTEEIYGKLCADREITAVVTGSTHIDVAWRWTYAQTRDKTARSFATALRMMEEYPEYRFMCSQPQLYAFLQEDHPDLYAQVKERIREGRWEVEGGMWIEADTNLPSGEALVRQFLYGTRFFEQEFGKTCRVLWLPDVFGYSAALPQIMKKCGINYFMTTKISWNEYDKIPYDTFTWRGIDGSEVLSHFICSQENRCGEKDYLTTYNAYLDPSTVMGAWKRYQQKDLNREVLISYGHGDGGGGPEPAMQEYGRRMAKGLPGCPQVRFGTARRFFEQLEADVAQKKRLPRWCGELYFEYHRGTYTTMGIIKKLNRKLEYLLQHLETAAVLADALTGEPAYPRDVLTDCWRTVLLNQFHDVLPGSSIHEVYEDVERMQRGVLETASKAMAEALARIDAALPAKRDGLLVFNPLSFERADIICAPIPEDVSHLETEDGERYPVQHGPEGAFCLASAPSKGCARLYYARGGEAAPCCAKADETGLENDFFRIGFDERMNIASLVDKRTGRELVPAGQSMNRLIVYEDKPFVDQAWNINVYYQEHSWPVDDLRAARVTENGPVRCVLEIERAFLSSTIRQQIILYKRLARIDVRNDIDWHERDLLLKTDFPTNVNSNAATFDIQFGNVQRTTHTNTLWDFAQFEVCGHKWADLSQDDFGLSLLTDCKYGWDAKDGHLRLTLLKSSCFPNPEADKGRHAFTYSIYPHAGGWREAMTDREGLRLNCPLVATPCAAHPGAADARPSLVSVDCPDIVVDTIKYAEDGDDVIIRLYENMNRDADFTLRLGFPAARAELCNLLEREGTPVALESGTIRGTIHPYEILTYRVGR